MPGATRSFYVDSAAGAYETAIVADLVPWVDAHFRTRPVAAGRGITGQSMGGYGALFLSLCHPRVFGAAYAVEPALVWGQRSLAERLPAAADVDHLLPADGAARSEWDLSGGEWQKVAMARAAMRDAALVILDEPTAALDADAEYQLFRRFRELVAGKTALLISHRFSTARMADQILVLEGGRIVEAGTHAELVARGGRYAALYEMQAGRYR